MKQKMVAIVFLLWFQSIGFAQSAGSDLQNRLSSFTSMQANFSQTVVSDSGKILQKLTGKMAISRPGKFYWHVQKPMEQIIVTNGQQLWIYEPDLEQVTVRNLQEGISQTPVYLLTHSHAYLKNNFNISYDKHYKDGNWFDLIPKQKNDLFGDIILGFYDDQLLQMQLDSSLGQHTVIRFTDVQINPKLDSIMFDFQAPAGVDVIDQTTGKS
ncbi:MAG: outer membrane lipoprotein chaperone LolA [Pseudomonadota bacterium]